MCTMCIHHTHNIYILKAEANLKNISFIPVDRQKYTFEVFQARKKGYNFRLLSDELMFSFLVQSKACSLPIILVIVN